MSESGWQSVMDDQIDIIRWWRSPAGKRYAKGFGKSVRRVQRDAYGYDAIEGDWVYHIEEIEVPKLWQAEPFYVAPDMMTLVEAAAETFQPEPLHPSDLITVKGFVVLPKPLYITDRHEKRVATRAFAWGPIVHYPGGDHDEEAVARMPRGDLAETGISLSLYSHKDDEDDFTVKYPELAAKRAKYELTHVTSWAYGMDVPTGSIAESQRSWWTPMQAFFRLTLQTIGDRYRQQPARSSVRRAQRELMPRDEQPYVTVIRLRRPKGKREGDPVDVNWQHRWLVDGHWRNQWYPSLGIHRQIYIAPHVKGPEDKPLLVRKGRAFELVR